MTEEFFAVKTDCSQMDVPMKIQKEGFIVRLLLQALQTLWATVNNHGAFTTVVEVVHRKTEYDPVARYREISMSVSVSSR